ncbi:uncharacterized protein LOC107042851 [Diachasma alloeum]|uniref:uncharacterized protein LOC107042851 n=1 Tax=Diachasma alloeum TaxID=454923 RepID=UPI0007384E00|nr:uncharacterized protein LOC107042851 [Diachasma alloeum]
MDIFKEENSQNHAALHRFNGKNFRLWKFQMEAALRGHGLKNYVNRTEVQPAASATTDARDLWQKRDGRAMTLIIGAMEPDIVEQFVECKTFRELWDALFDLHEKKSAVSGMTLYEEFFALKMVEGESVTAYVKKVPKIAAELESQEEVLSDNLQMIRIISTLTPMFKNYKTVWYNKSNKSLKTLLGELRLEKDQLNKADQTENVEAAFATRGSVAGHRRETGRVSNGKSDYKLVAALKKTMKCNCCGEVGHWATECSRSSKNRKSRFGQHQKTSECTFVASIEDVRLASYTEVWLSDSAATAHMTGRRDWFNELTVQDTGSSAVVANGVTPRARRTDRGLEFINSEWFLSKPALGHVKTFGTPGFVHVPKRRRKKLDPKAEKMFLVRFKSTSRNYRMFDPSTGKFVITCDVVFNEEKVENVKPDVPVGLYVFDEEEEKAEDKTKKKELVIPKVNVEKVQSEEKKEKEKLLIPEVNAEEVQTDGDLPTPGEHGGIRQNTTYSLRQVLSPPDRFPFSACVLEEFSAAVGESSTYEEALSRLDGAKWKAAIQEELDALEANKTWELFEKPEGREVISCKWVYRIKTAPDSTQQRYNARLVVRGFSQCAGIYYKETFTPVVRRNTIRVMLAVAAIKALEILEFNIKTAFLNADLEEEIYMELPKGCKPDNIDVVCLLKKSLYALKQAPRTWNQKFLVQKLRYHLEM